jgi:hypothetical protein
MLDQLLHMFGQSPQGQLAYTQLQQQGYTAQQSAGILTTAFPAAVSAMQNALHGNAEGGLGLLDITKSNYASNFLTAAVTGLIRGEGLKGAAVDGLQGVVGGHVAQVIASRCGLPERVAGVAGAVIVPPMIDFLYAKFQELQASGGFASLLGGTDTHAQTPAGFGAVRR